MMRAPLFMYHPGADGAGYYSLLQIEIVARHHQHTTSAALRSVNGLAATRAEFKATKHHDSWHLKS